MSLTADDLKAVKRAVDDSLNERMPIIIDVHIKPMFAELEERINGAFEDTQVQINAIKTDVTGLKKDISDLRIEIADVKKDVKDTKITVRRLELRGTLKT